MRVVRVVRDRERDRKRQRERQRERDREREKERQKEEKAMSTSYHYLKATKSLVSHYSLSLTRYQ